MQNLERPDQRCLKFGARCLSLRECLAVLLGPGSQTRIQLASRVLNRPGEHMPDDSIEDAFFTAMEVSAHAHLEGIRGLGPAHQAKLLAAFEIGRRYLIHSQGKRAALSRRVIPGSEVENQALKRVPVHLRAESQEWLGFVALDRADKVGPLCVVERGVRTHVNVDPAELFARILALRPRGLVLFHNHPSGSLTPSEADYDLTERVAELARKFGIELIGHWIVTMSGERLIEVGRRFS